MSIINMCGETQPWRQIKLAAFFSAFSHGVGHARRLANRYLINYPFMDELKRRYAVR
ncbi:hypothetical protein BN133_2624 [Cronobacter dublinensis 582]|nr:hypothetical protein BN133_2624 [Cronobacter dublinensis 582]